MKNMEAKKKMLRNAGEIQYYANILFDNEYNYIAKSCGVWVIRHYQEGYGLIDSEIPEKIAKFFIKGRVLRSALATAMARYYGHRAVQRAEGWAFMPRF